MYEDGDEKTRRLIGEAMSKKGTNDPIKMPTEDDY